MPTDPEPSPFLLGLHDSFAVAPEAVIDLVHRAVGAFPTTMSRVVRGYDNEVYRAGVGDRHVFVRIKRFGEDLDFTGEAWAMGQARDAGVPVPQLLLVDAIAAEDGSTRPTMVLAAAEGTEISRRSDLSPADRSVVLRRAGEVLARLHTVRTPGFWRAAADGSWPTGDWESLMDRFVDGRAAERALIVSTGFTDAEFDRMLDLMRSYTREFPCRQPVLCHGDFQLDHIFIDDTLHVSGLIDFGMFGGGPPVGDFACMTYALPPSDVDAILAGYGLPTRAQRRAIDLHTIGVAIGNLAHEVGIGDTVSAERGARSLAATLRRL